MRGRMPCELAVPSKTGTVLSDPIWRFSGRCRLECSLGFRSGAIIRLLLAVFMRVSLPYNGRERPHPISIGWQFWAILAWLPDCSNCHMDLNHVLKSWELAFSRGIFKDM